MGEPYRERLVSKVREGVYVVPLIAEDPNNLLVLKGPNMENKGKLERVQVVVPERNNYDCSIDWIAISMLCDLTELSGLEGEIITGGVKSGERLMDAALRESKEERGLDPVDNRLVYIPENESNRVAVNQTRKGMSQSFRLHGFGSKLSPDALSMLNENHAFDVVNFSQLGRYLIDHKSEIRVSTLAILHNLLLNPHLFYYLAS